MYGYERSARTGGLALGWVWTVMVSFSNEELWDDGQDEPRETCMALERINTWIGDGQLVSLASRTYHGNGPGMDANLYGGGFKHLDIERFIELVEAQDWKDRGKVQLWIKGGEEGMSDEPFKLIKLRKRTASHPKQVD
jgi:hypothetical protein